MTHPTDDAFARLHLAGSSLGELCCHTPKGPRWYVTASRAGVTVRGQAGRRPRRGRRACRRPATPRPGTADMRPVGLKGVFLAPAGRRVTIVPMPVECDR